MVNPIHDNDNDNNEARMQTFEREDDLSGKFPDDNYNNQFKLELDIISNEAATPSYIKIGKLTGLETDEEAKKIIEKNIVIIKEFEAKSRNSLNISIDTVKKKKLSEDANGVIVAFGLFFCTLVFSFCNISLHSFKYKIEWPLGFICVSLLVILVSHYLLHKEQQIEGYALLLLISVTAKSLGSYYVFKKNSLNSTFWAIIIGTSVRYLGINPTLGLSGEYFIKIGVTMLCMDFSAIGDIGLPGLAVAWLDTCIVFIVGISFAKYIMGIDFRSSIVISGATCICGSSAAVAIAGSIHTSKDEKRLQIKQSTQTIIAIMGLLNTPLLPLMALVHTSLGINPIVVGSWIGGSIDSTGQVIAAASLANSSELLSAATIIKMFQNLLIGPICVFLTMYFQKSFKFQILLDKFPLFVAGFLITSIIANTIRISGITSSDVEALIVSNSWFISEWINLIGFSIIGIQIDFKNFMKNANFHVILYTYLCIQGFDLLTTFGWSYLMFNDNYQSNNALYD